MKSKTNKQVREEVKKHLAAKYATYVEYQKKRYSDLWDKYQKALSEASEARAENNRLREQLAAIEDWNRRLLEFMDMPEEKRQEAFKEYVAAKKRSEALDSMFSTYNRFFERLGLYI